LSGWKSGHLYFGNAIVGNPNSVNLSLGILGYSNCQQVRPQFYDFDSAENQARLLAKNLSAMASTVKSMVLGMHMEITFSKKSIEVVHITNGNYMNGIMKQMMKITDALPGKSYSIFSD
jgi:hypothetical protein